MRDILLVQPFDPATRRQLSVLLMLAAWIWLPAGTRASEPTRLRLMSYNIHHGVGIDGNLDLPRIAKVIQKASADIVALQEVDRLVRRSNEVDQPQVLARLTGMHVCFGGNIKLQGGEYGNAVLSRYPIARFENHHLPSIGQGEQRGLLEVEIDLPEAETLVVLATHFDHRRDDAERVQSATQINRMLLAKPTLSRVLLGDINDQLGSHTLRTLQEVWTSANKTALPTIPVGTPTRQIDFIMVAPASHWQIVDTQVLDEAVASDHRGILATARLLPTVPKPSP